MDRCSALERCVGPELDVLTVANGNEAIAAIGRHEVAVLLADMRGFEAEALLRAVGERSPSTFRIVTSELIDIDRMLAWRDEGLVSSYVVSPWRDDELHQLLRWGYEAWTLAHDVDVTAPTPTIATLLHDLKSPLMTILANADHLHTLAATTPKLCEVIASLSIAPEQRDLLEQLVEDLQPISEELSVAVRRINHLVDQLRATTDNVTHERPLRTRSK